MRDAESILDQVLAAGDDPLTEARVGDLLGLVDAETVIAFLDALVRGRALAGLAAIDGLEERGRDLHVFLDQVVDALRQALTGQLGGAAGSWPIGALVGVAHRLAAIDPSRASIGGLRFQLELALLEGRPADVRAAPTAAPVSRTAAPVSPTAAPVPSRAAADPTGSAPAAKPPVAARPAAKPFDPEPATEPAPPGKPGATASKPASNPAGKPSGQPAGEPSSPTAVQPPSPGLAELIAAWPTIVAELSSSPPIKPLVEACRPVEMTGNQVVLGFPVGKAFLRDVAERRRTHLEEGIGRVLGRAVAVRLVATNLDLLPAPGGDEADLLTMARRVFADDLIDADEVR